MFDDANRSSDLVSRGIIERIEPREGLNSGGLARAQGQQLDRLLAVLAEPHQFFQPIYGQFFIVCEQKGLVAVAAELAVGSNVHN